LWNRATATRNVVQAIAYATDKKDSKQVNFQNILRRIGFSIKLKPYIQRCDGSTKGDWDVGIALDMLELAKKVDIIVLASGDGDFAFAVDKITESHNTEVEVYGVKALTAHSLIKAATRFIPIEGEYLLPIQATW
jgi:uncharacterized LabA/DUF88 family protein